MNLSCPPLIPWAPGALRFSSTGGFSGLACPPSSHPLSSTLPSPRNQPGLPGSSPSSETPVHLRLGNPVCLAPQPLCLCPRCLLCSQYPLYPTAWPTPTQCLKPSQCQPLKSHSQPTFSFPTQNYLFLLGSKSTLHQALITALIPTYSHLSQ